MDRASFSMPVVMILVSGRQGSPLARRHLKSVYRVIFTTPVPFSIRCDFAMLVAGVQIENERSFLPPLSTRAWDVPPMDAPATVT